MSALPTYCYISEQTSYAEDYQDGFGYKVHERGNRFYLTFDAILQSFGIFNRNKRLYEASNIMERIENDEYIQDQLRRNSWMGEIDHPSPIYAGKELTINRISTPDLKLSSHYIRRPRLSGNLLEATIQTDSSNENGMNMAIKIVDGKIVPGFSARVLGELRNRGGRPVVHVKKLITYDWVGYPSHSDALGKLSQPLAESVDIVEKKLGSKILFLNDLAKMAANNSKETEWLCESFGLGINDVIGITGNGNSVVIQENANVYIQPISSKRIREKTSSLVKDWINQ